MLFWDFLFALFVALPVITGGIWIDRPGLRLEYTQPGPAALVLLLALWWMSRKGRDPARASYVFRLASSFWQRWSAALRLNPLRRLVPAWLLVSACWFFSAYRRHMALQSGAADLGIFTNALWNVAREGWPYSSIKGGMSFLADHQMFSLYPLGWLFSLWPSPTFLLLLQALGLASGAIALTLLGIQRLGIGSRWLPFLPLLYWTYAPLRAANLFDFHPEVFLLPLLLFAAYLLQEPSLRKRLGGMALLIGALSCKESAGPVVAGFGLAWILGAGPESTRPFTRRLGAFALALGLAFFVLDIKFIPSWLGVTYTYGSVYTDFGAGPFAVFLAPFTHPLLFLQRLFGLSRLRFLFGLLFPLGFLPLFAPAALVASFPGLLMLMLTAGEQRLSLGFHYGIEPAAGLFLALIPALATSWVAKRERWLLLALPWLLLVNLHRSDAYYWRRFEPSAHAEWLHTELLPALDPRVSVSASSALVPHLSARHWVHFLPILQDEKSRQAQCVLWDHSVNNTPMGAGDERRLQSVLVKDYLPEFQCSPITVMRLKSSPVPCLTRFLDCK